MKAELTLVIPVHNEQGNLSILMKEIKRALDKKIGYKVIFVDDGSKDASPRILKQITSKEKNVKVIRMLSNYGQSQAIAAGVSQVDTPYIVTMDSDLQHDPKDILPLVEGLKRGYHVVCGWRKHGYSINKSIPSKVSNFLIRVLTKINLHDSTGGMRAFRKEVADNIQLYGEMHRYLPLFARWKGFRVTEYPIHIRKRGFGRTHYGMRRLFRGFFDLLTITFFMTYSSKPLHIFGGFGVLVFLAGFLISFILLIGKLFYKVALLNHQPLLLLSITLMVLGVTSFFFGLLGDMINYSTMESSKRRGYIIEKIIK